MNYDDLIQELKRAYPLHIEQIKLHREMIGGVYYVQCRNSRYVLKIYRSFKAADALQSVRILDYLQAHSYPAVPVIRTVQQESHIVLEHHGAPCVAILYEYIEGEMPDGTAEAADIGQQIGELHQVMQQYPEPLIRRAKADYIDDYISIMRELDCDGIIRSSQELSGARACIQCPRNSVLNSTAG